MIIMDKILIKVRPEIKEAYPEDIKVSITTKTL